MGSSFEDKYYYYINITKKIYDSSPSDLTKLAINYFQKKKNEIENKVKNEINSLKKYYFEDKLYKEYIINFENIKNDPLHSLFNQTKFLEKNSQLRLNLQI